MVMTSNGMTPKSNGSEQVGVSGAQATQTMPVELQSTAGQGNNDRESHHAVTTPHVDTYARIPNPEKKSSGNRRHVHEAQTVHDLARRQVEAPQSTHS